ncbi:MAG TPA: ubiquinone/menaquinone biosynthesis methyltransferase [Chloroflexota bacterium]|jgi:demethylmenaquinone methyltransferase/2-methoxy-6-polyprenyl-1,4-benzoquinol methylase
MFDRVAARYDLLNALNSLGNDRRWRRAAAEAADPAGKRVLDLAAGTGHLAVALLGAGASHVVAVDFSSEMLAAARTKLYPRFDGRVSLAQGDALTLPFGNGVFDRVTSGFLLRNLADLRQGLSEMLRVLKPSGRMVALDITRPGVGVGGRLAGAYFQRVVPWVGGLISGEVAAYAYLAKSVQPFPPPDQLADLMREVGFLDVQYCRMGLGLVALHSGRAP